MGSVDIEKFTTTDEYGHREYNEVSYFVTWTHHADVNSEFGVRVILDQDGLQDADNNGKTYTYLTPSQAIKLAEELWHYAHLANAAIVNNYFEAPYDKESS